MEYHRLNYNIDNIAYSRRVDLSNNLSTDFFDDGKNDVNRTLHNEVSEEIISAPPLITTELCHANAKLAREIMPRIIDISSRQFDACRRSITCGRTPGLRIFG